MQNSYSYISAVDAAHLYEPAIQIAHAIDVQSLPFKSRLFIDASGTASYTEISNSQSHDVHLGVKSIYNVYSKYLDTNADFYGALEFTRQHELCHLLYTGGQSYEWAVNSGRDKVLEFIAKKEGQNSRLRKKADAENLMKYLTDKYHFNIGEFITSISASIANCLEDGRIERIRSAKDDFFAKERCYYRGTCFWDTPKNLLPSKEKIKNSSIIHLQVLVNQILSLSKCQAYQKGFTMAFGNTTLMTEVNELMPFIAEGYIAKTTREMAKACQKICEYLAPLIYDASLEAAKSATVPPEFAEFVKALLAMIIESESFGNDADAEEDDTNSLNSAMPFSNLTIVLPDDQYDKLKEKAKEGNGSSGINVVREHPLPEDNSDNESHDHNSYKNSSDSTSTFQTSESSNSQTSESGNSDSTDTENESTSSTDTTADSGNANNTNSSNCASNPANNTSNTTDDSSEPNSGEDFINSTDTKTNTNNSGSGSNETPEQIELKMKEAADSVKAKSRQATDSINTTAISNSSKKHNTKEKLDTSELISPNDVKDICNFKEYRRKYAVKDKLPSDLQNKGNTMRRKMERYFKSLQSPTTRFQRSGLLDRKAISRLAKNNIQIFRKTGKSKKIDLAVYILIDNSGSMGHTKREAACEAAAIIEEGFKDLVPLKIVGFDTTSTINHEIIKNWDESLHENCCWNYCLHGRHGSGNDDDKDIRIAARELLSRPETKKILIVLSDGAPFDTKATRDAISTARKSGVQVSGIYFEEGDVTENKEFVYMYQKDYVCCTLDKIEPNLSSIMEKFAHSK